ncbi:NUDIX hydrolase [Dictyobacter formicarum]|uniref:Nudix hydrolase domain-containing protein n=1 Tax=Dictyobacter formicarum TaxID=2778368 RepID=A0ABQ3VKB4_9CHLR|nr:NUDIX hydrolase [Dictyobacter formicarum]GHO86048.1 hypothetical protein KSZ_40540 [Dictyobacter formicarum]
MFYYITKSLACICFNILNFLLGGNLPPFGCVCMIVEKDQQFLLIEQPGGILAFPGGFMKWRESPEQALIREGKEETGLELRPLDLVGFQPGISQGIHQMSTLTLIYQVEAIGGDLRPSSEGRPLWLSADELQKRLSPYYQSMLEQYKRYQATDSLRNTEQQNCRRHGATAN